LKIKLKLKYISKENTMKLTSDINLTKLKVKAKSLAAEARIIRKEEYKKLRHLKVCQYEHQDYDKGWWRWHRETQDANIAFWTLQNHRRGIVRAEARATNIARAFLRGVPYDRVEPNARDTVEQSVAMSRAKDIIAKYGHLEKHFAKDFIKDRPERKDYSSVKEHQDAVRKHHRKVVSDIVDRWYRVVL
jgi:hypothetical protein